MYSGADGSMAGELSDPGDHLYEEIAVRARGGADGGTRIYRPLERNRTSYRNYDQASNENRNNAVETETGETVMGGGAVENHTLPDPAALYDERTLPTLHIASDNSPTTSIVARTPNANHYTPASAGNPVNAGTDHVHDTGGSAVQDNDVQVMNPLYSNGALDVVARSISSSASESTLYDNLAAAPTTANPPPTANPRDAYGDDAHGDPSQESPYDVAAPTARIGPTARVGHRRLRRTTTPRFARSAITGTKPLLPHISPFETTFPVSWGQFQLSHVRSSVKYWECCSN